MPGWHWQTVPSGVGEVSSEDSVKERTDLWEILLSDCWNVEDLFTRTKITKQ